MNKIPGLDRYSLQPREGPSPALRKFGIDNVGVKIKSIQIARKPIISGVSKFLNIISFGNFDKTRRKLGYNDVYHNYLLVELENGKKVKLEKNEIVEVKPSSSEDYTTEVHNIPVNKDIDINSLLSNATKLPSGRKDPDFWKYSARDRNCQQFTKEVIERNGLQPEDKNGQEVLNPQDAKKLVDSLGVLKGIPQITTDLAGGVDRFINGNGLSSKNCKCKHGGKLTVNKLFDIVNSI
jgi:hypothetical protein